MPSEHVVVNLLPCRWCLGPARLTEIKGSPTNPFLVSCETSSNGSCPMTLAMTPEEWNTRATKCNHPGAHTSWCNYGKSAPASPLIVPACPHLHVDVMSFCMDCGRYRHPPTAQGDTVPAGRAHVLGCKLEDDHDGLCDRDTSCGKWSKGDTPAEESK